MEIDVIREQKWSVILGMPQLAHHNPEIDWRIGEVKNDEVPRGVWKVMKVKAGKIGVAKTKGRREERGRRKEMRREGTEERERK